MPRRTGEASARGAVRAWRWAASPCRACLLGDLPAAPRCTAPRPPRPARLVPHTNTHTTRQCTRLPAALARITHDHHQRHPCPLTTAALTSARAASSAATASVWPLRAARCRGVSCCGRVGGCRDMGGVGVGRATEGRGRVRCDLTSGAGGWRESHAAKASAL
jgi:hypothetical protein